METGSGSCAPSPGVKVSPVFVDTRGGHVEAKGQIKPGDFTNFDNRFYTKTLANSTFQKANTASKGSRGWFKDSNTGMIFSGELRALAGQPRGHSASCFVSDRLRLADGIKQH